MASERQIEANRRNAAKSTGPRTPPGKEASRCNSFKHGLTGDGPVVDSAMQGVIAERKADWAGEYPALTAAQQWTFEKLVVASAQVDRSELAMDVHIADHAARARGVWDEDRRLDAEEVAARLAVDPSRTVKRLETSRHGVELMLDRWARLNHALDAEGGWDESELAHALDLLGIAVGLRRGRNPFDPPEGVDPLTHRRERLYREIDRLAALKTKSVDDLDAVDRLNASATMGAELTKTGRRLHRYEKEAWSRFFRHQRELRESPSPHAASPPLAKPPAEGPSTDEGVEALLLALVEHNSRQTTPDRGRDEAPKIAREVPCPLTSEDSERALREVTRQLAEEHASAIGTPVEGRPIPARPDTPRIAPAGTKVIDVVAPLRPMNRQQRRAEKARSRQR